MGKDTIALVGSLPPAEGEIAVNVGDEIIVGGERLKATALQLDDGTQIPFFRSAGERSRLVQG